MLASTAAVSPSITAAISPCCSQASVGAWRLAACLFFGRVRSDDASHVQRRIRLALIQRRFRRNVRGQLFDSRRDLRFKHSHRSQTARGFALASPPRPAPLVTDHRTQCRAGAARASQG